MPDLTKEHNENDTHTIVFADLEILHTDNICEDDSSHFKTQR